MYPVDFLVKCNFAAVILLASLAFIVQFSLPCDKLQGLIRFIILFFVFFRVYINFMGLLNSENNQRFLLNFSDRALQRICDFYKR